MRRSVLVLALLLVLLVVADLVVRSRLTNEAEDAAAAGFSATTADADVGGVLVLPQVVTGRIDELGLDLREGVVGDPAVRAERIEVTLIDVEIGFPPPAALTVVDVSGGSVRITVHEREVERLFREQRPGWAVTVSTGGVRATGMVQGVDVVVVAEVIPEGDVLQIRAREVDAAGLGPDAGRIVASAFDAAVPLGGLPGTVRLNGAIPADGALVLTAAITAGSLDLG